MSYGAYFATQPSTRTYIDTSQPLNGYGGFGADDGLLAIYDGVAGVGAAPSPGCGCAGTRGRLSGFGNEVLPDGTTGGGGLSVGVTQGTNIQTALVALLVVSSVAIAGYMLLGGSKTMRANGRKRRMRKNGRRKMRANGGATFVKDYEGHWACLDGSHKEIGWVNEENGMFWVTDPWNNYGHRASLAAAKQLLLKELGYTAQAKAMTANGRLNRNGAPAYLLTKKGKTTKRQAKAAGHYLAETRWHGGPKRVARWSGKHLAHKRFNTNGAAARWTPVSHGYALKAGGQEVGGIDVQSASKFVPYFLGKHGHFRRCAAVGSLSAAKKAVETRLRASVG
jgi:hypothetical protein